MEINNPKPAIGISSCLLGNNVRYDGKNKRAEYVIHNLSQLVDFIAFCPEVGIGLGVPRKPIHLVANPGRHPEAVFIHAPDINVTNALITYAEQISMDYPDISGFIFKSRSPSCGLHNTPVFNPSDEKKISIDSGVFAKQLSLIKPLLPIANENELQTTKNLSIFVKKIRAYTTTRI